MVPWAAAGLLQLCGALQLGYDPVHLTPANQCSSCYAGCYTYIRNALLLIFETHTARQHLATVASKAQWCGSSAAITAATLESSLSRILRILRRWTAHALVGAGNTLGAKALH